MTHPSNPRPADSFDFRPLEQNDMERLHRWFHAPHAKQWFGGGRSLESVHDEYSEYLEPDQPIRVYIVEYAGRPIGMLNWERMGDSPEFQQCYKVEDPNSVNCDMILGESDIAHRGFGSTILRQFLRRIVFVDPRLTSCIIDPVPENAIAIRMYEKAGFRFVRALPDDGEGNGLYLMELSRSDLEAASLPPRDFYVRPARVEEVPLAVEIDDDACLLYEEAGLHLELDENHPFVAHEINRWTEAARHQRLLFACAPNGEPIGFAAFDFVDGRPHLDQLSVRRSWMKRGIGRALVARAKAWSIRRGELWLTTYGQGIPWNAPWYARIGFVVTDQKDLGSELSGRLAAERAVLPAGDQRVAMVFRHR